MKRILLTGTSMALSVGLFIGTVQAQEGAPPPPSPAAEEPAPAPPNQGPADLTVPLGDSLDGILGPITNLNCAVSSPGGVMTVLQCEERPAE